MQKRRTYQQLQPEERMTIASMKQQGSSVRAMARTLGRSASTVSRELTRNTCSVVGYAAAPPQALSRSRREGARPCPKLHPQSMSWRVVLTLLEWKWSPQQISGTLKRMWPVRHGVACKSCSHGNGRNHPCHRVNPGAGIKSGSDNVTKHRKVRGINRKRRTLLAATRRM